MGPALVRMVDMTLKTIDPDSNAGAVVEYFGEELKRGYLCLAEAGQF